MFPLRQNFLPAYQRLIAINPLNVGGAHHCHAFVFGVVAHHSCPVRGRGQVSLAVRADVHPPHNIDRRSQAIPSIGVQQFNDGTTHHIDARADQYQRRRICDLSITGVFSNSKHLYRCLQGLELYAGMASGVQVSSHLQAGNQERPATRMAA